MVNVGDARQAMPEPESLPPHSPHEAGALDTTCGTPTNSSSCTEVPVGPANSAENSSAPNSWLRKSKSRLIWAGTSANFGSCGKGMATVESQKVKTHVSAWIEEACQQYQHK